MILLDNGLYVLEACKLLETRPGYRIIPLTINCLTGSNIEISSWINLLFIAISLFILFSAFHLSKKSSLIFSALFSYNGLIAFPVFYAAAHSYVYTLLIASCALLTLKREKFYTKTFLPLVIFMSLLLNMVRSEGTFYFIILSIAFLIYRSIEVPLNKLWSHNKKMIQRISTLAVLAVIINIIITEFINYGVDVTNNLTNPSYTYQYPVESFKPLSIWASLSYFSYFLAPPLLSFYGNYNDWYTIHINQLFQSGLWGLLLVLILSCFFIFLKRKKSKLSYIVLGIGVFIVPTFLISSFLRNQWFYPSRALLGAYCALPFFVAAILKLKKQKLVLGFLFLFYTLSFGIHKFYHFKNTANLYKYETEILGLKHPVTAKRMALKHLENKNYPVATKILRYASRELPPKGIYQSANTFFYYAENLYWTAAVSFASGNKLTERLVLTKLYKEPNFFTGMACIQDTKTSLDRCASKEILTTLCNPVYKRKFGYVYYKKPRVKAELLCAKNGHLLK